MLRPSTNSFKTILKSLSNPNDLLSKTFSGACTSLNQRKCPTYSQLNLVARCLFTSSQFLTNCHDLKLVRKEEKTVKPYGYLELQNLDLDLIIKPASPDAFPNMDRAICTFYSTNESISPDFMYNDDMLTVNSQKSYETAYHKCCVEVPIKYEVDIANLMGQNSVVVESLETVSVRVATSSGTITTSNLKGNHICLLSQSGNINCKNSIQGRIILQSGSGEISGRKFQGPSLKVTSNSGNINAQSIYSDVSHFVSVSGNITLKNLHMKSHVKITGSGNLTISGMDGSLHALLGLGHHDIQISQLRENSYVQVAKGTLTLKVPHPCPFAIRINAASIHATEKMLAVGTLGEGPSQSSQVFEYHPSTDVPLVEIEAFKGQVNLENEDWFSSLKLGFSND